MKIKYALPLGALLSGLFIVAGCELTTPFERLSLYEVDPIIYTQFVQPILDDKCTRCHIGADAARGLRLDSWPNVVAGSDFGEAVIPFDGENSLMVKMTSRLAGGPHPFELEADTLTTEEFDFLKRWIKEGAKFDDGSIPNADATQLLYVPNQNDALISVIDIESKKVIRTIDLTKLEPAYSPNARPHDIELDPNGENWYVTLIGDNKVVKMGQRPNNINLFIGEVNFETPGMLAVNPQTDQLFVARSLSAVSPPQSVGVINRSEMSIEEVNILFPRPHALVVNPLGTYAHTGSLVENRVMTIDTDTKEVTFTLLSAPFNAFIHFSMSPDGNTIAASGQSSNQVAFINSSAPPGLSRIGAIEVGNEPWHPVWTPDGEFVYVGNKDDNTVSVIDVNAFSVMQTISGNGLAEPHGSAISPDGNYVFISNRNTNGSYTPRYDFGNNQDTGTVVVINTATNEIEKIIEVGRYPAGLSTIRQ